MAKKIYFDSCVWIRLIQKEPGYENIEYAIERAKTGEIEIWTSSLALAEVYKMKCGSIAEVNDVAFEDFIQQDFVVEVQLDHSVAVKGRALCRAHAKLKKPNDGVHLATAVLWNCDEFYTIDGTDLLPLNELVQRADGTNLPIIEPPPKPPPAATPGLGPLFEPAPV